MVKMSGGEALAQRSYGKGSKSCSGFPAYMCPGY